MRFLNPKTRFAFARVFGSQQSHDVVLDFLNALLILQGDLPVQEAEIPDPYLATKLRILKDAFVNLRVKDGTGRQFIIEIQVLSVADFDKKEIHDICKAHAGELHAGQPSRGLNNVIAIAITDFVMFPKQDALLSRFKLRDDDGQTYSEDLQLIVVELPKFDQDTADLNSPLDAWLYFLKCAGDLDAVPDTLRQQPALNKAFETANTAGLTQAELDNQEQRERYITTQRTMFQAARDRARAEGEAEGEAKGKAEGRAEGKAEGKAEGRAEGKAEGKAQAQRAIATQLLKSLPDDQLIADATGLSVDEVRRLRGLDDK